MVIAKSRHQKGRKLTKTRSSPPWLYLSMHILNKQVTIARIQPRQPTITSSNMQLSRR